MTDIRCWYDHYSRLWIVTAHDAEGNQLWDAQYYPNRQALAADWGVK